MMLFFTMNDVVTKIVEQSPALGVMVVIVIIFLRHIRGEREQQNLFFSQIHEDNLAARHQMRDALEKNSGTIIENVRVTTKNTETLDRLARTIEKCDMKGLP